MKSIKPYMFRAVFNCIVDSKETPEIIVDTSVQGVDVPVRYIKNNRITLNICPMASPNMVISNEVLVMDTRFAGVLTDIIVPIEAILVIRSRESKEGIAFSTYPTSTQKEDTETTPVGPLHQGSSADSKFPSYLKVVK